MRYRIIFNYWSQSQGYGVASIFVGEESKIAGVLLRESGLRDADLMVLSVERDEEIIPVPKAQTKIQAGDRLVCYGKLENLDGLVQTEEPQQERDPNRGGDDEFTETI